MTQHQQAWLAITVTLIAGYVDAVGYLALSHIYTANMSGNSIAVGIAAAQAHWRQVFHHGWPVLIFVCGLILSALLAEVGVQYRCRSTAAVTLGLEALLLTLCVVLGKENVHVLQGTPDSPFPELVALLALAMGLQNATVTRVGTLTVHTTHVTGALTKLAEEVAHLLVRLYAYHRGRQRQPANGESLLLAGLWFAFVVGAAGGTSATQRWGFSALLLPIGVLLLCVGLDLWRPLGVSSQWSQQGSQ